MPGAAVLSGSAEVNGKHRAFPKLAFDLEGAAMPVDDVLDDGKSEPSAAHRPRPRRVDPVEAFGEPRQVLAADAVAVVAHGDRNERHGSRPPLSKAGGDADRGPLATVFDGVVDEVLEDLRQLVGLAHRFR